MEGIAPRRAGSPRRHPRESGDLVGWRLPWQEIPAFAGMTEVVGRTAPPYACLLGARQARFQLNRVGEVFDEEIRSQVAHYKDYRWIKDRGVSGIFPICWLSRSSKPRFFKFPNSSYGP